MTQSGAQPTHGGVPPPRQWTARLELDFAQRAGRTRLDRNRHSGPLRVQRLFHPEAGGKAHCYLLHPPGGVVLGDELQVEVTVSSGAALLTTPSAGRFYSVGDHGEKQQQRVLLNARAGLLEWLPQETILFSGANAHLDTRIELAGGARLAFWDVLVLGRPACDERFDIGRVQQRLDVFRDGRPLLCERLALEAGDRLSRSAIGLHGCSTLGIALFSDVSDDTNVDAWLQGVSDGAGGSFSVTRRTGLLIARYRGHDALRCREGFAGLWRAVCRRSGDEVPATPRIWHT